MPKPSKYNNLPEVITDYVTGCWLWQRCLDTKGYGIRCIPGTQSGNARNNKKEQAHRYYYKQFRGNIPDGKTLNHECEIKNCCNPWHLSIMTREDNNRLRFNPKLTPNIEVI